MQHMHGIIPKLFDCWANPVVHLLLQWNSMDRVILKVLAWSPIVREESLACQINNKQSCFIMKFQRLSYKNNHSFCSMGKLSGKLVITLSLKSSIVLGNKIATKAAQKFYIFLGYFENITFKNKKLLWLLFGQLLQRFGLLFNPTSSHTAFNGERERSKNPSRKPGSFYEMPSLSPSIMPTYLPRYNK